MIFQQAANQFRHFFISFGFDDLSKQTSFMGIICAGITAIMLIYSLTPLYQWVWGTVMGLPAELISIARDATLIMCLMPAIIIYRNYFHAHLMMMRRHRRHGLRQYFARCRHLCQRSIILFPQLAQPNQRHLYFDPGLCY